jgi:Domain of Unknown Function (DUF1259)
MRSMRQSTSCIFSSAIAKKSSRIHCAALLLAIIGVSSSVAEVPEEARVAIDRIIDSKGTYIADEGVYKVVLPREAATIVLDYQTLSPNIGLNSWAAFTPAFHDEALLTGQLLLLEDEVDPLLTTTLNAGLQVTGLVDLSIFEGPRLKVLDVTGVGGYQSLASMYREALDEMRRVRAEVIRKSTKFSLPTLSLDSSIDPGPLNNILSMRGGISQGVYRAAIGRRGLVGGETIGREMGISTWISFAGANDNALAQGEAAATSDELHRFLEALLSKGFKIISIRNHLVGEHPQYLFIRFWQQGRSIELARGLRYALDVQVGRIATESDAKRVE